MKPTGFDELKGRAPMTDEEFQAFLEANGYLDIRKLPDGWVAIAPQIFTWVLCVGLDAGGYARRYDFDELALCRAELEKMTSIEDIPAGWTRQMPEPFFFTIVGYQENALHIGDCKTEREIMDAANFQHYCIDGTMPFDNPSGESFKAAMARLNQEGRVFEAYDTGTQAPLFLERARAIGLEEEAAKLVENVRQWRA